MQRDEELIGSISTDVMAYLLGCQFFEKLDDLLSPSESVHPSQACDGSYRHSESILLTSGHKECDLADVFGVLRSKGGACDCEILYNVVESSRLKAKYWRKQHALKNPVGHVSHVD